MNDELQKFITDFNAEVVERAMGDGECQGNFKETAFTGLVLEYLEEYGVIENPHLAYFGGKVGKSNALVNGYAINEEEDTLDLFSTVFVNAGEASRISSDDLRKSAEQPVRFFDGACRELHKTMEPASEAFAMANRIYDLKKQIKNVRVFILTDGVSGKKEINPMALPNGIPISFHVWDIERLFRILQSGRPQDEIMIDFIKMHGAPLPCIRVPTDLPEYSACMAILPGELLFKMYDQFGARLLERNVRAFLQARGKVNKGIRATLRSEPTRFLAYNNGISVTVESLVTAILPDGGLGIASAKGLQIVNGGQTTASIYRAKRYDKVDISQVFVPAKITALHPDLLDEFAPKIAEYANTQNVIQMADFSSNDPFHIAIERLSNTLWCPGEQERWFYERARGQYQIAMSAATTPAQKRQFKERTPVSRKFTKIDMAKFLNSWEQRPHIVSMGGQKNFVMFMQELREARSKEWVPDDRYYREMIAKAIICRQAYRIVSQEKFPAYRANIVAYLVSMLSFSSGGRFDLGMVWERQEISQETEDLLRSWSHIIIEGIIDSSGGKNITEWCKKEVCWKGIKDITELTLPDILPPELQSRTVKTTGWGSKPEEKRVNILPDELEALARCKRVEAEEWMRIVAWGRETGILDTGQRKLVSQMGNRAAEGWKGDLSGKQALEARKILNLAEEQGGPTGTKPL
ncbi:MAG: AIPR family protein [Magnetococcales bacterium]|nr:AIPR family protein [Magnetococcales bacterium]